MMVNLQIPKVSKASQTRLVKKLSCRYCIQFIIINMISGVPYKLGLPPHLKVHRQ